MASRGRPRLLRLSLEELHDALQSATTATVAARYGVGPSTIYRLRLAFRLPRGQPGPPRGRSSGPSARYGSGQVEATIRTQMPTDRWVDATAVWGWTGGRKQRVYQILSRLCAEGFLERRGRWQHYEWRRTVPEGVTHGLS